MLFASSCCADNEEYKPLFKCSKRLDNPYGICSHISRKGSRYEFDTREDELKMIDSVGISWIRTDWDWPSMMLQGTDSLRYNHFDSLMSSVHAYRKNVLGIITLRKNFKMTELDKWIRYVEHTSHHYSQVPCWEIINEVDIINHWLPGIYAKDYVKLLKVGSAVIKRDNKNTKVAFSGIANTDTKFIDSVFSAGVSSYFDIMNVHRYSPKTVEPEVLLDYFTHLSQKLIKYSLKKNVWLTECGTSSVVGATEQSQANRLPRIFIISFACGIDKVFWYKSRSREQNPKDKEDFFGLWHKDYTPKPAYYAYKTLTMMCPDKSTRPSLKRKGNVFMSQWKRPDGKKVYALWTSEKDEIIKLNYSGTFTCYDINGKEIKINGQSVEITPSVKYLVGGKKFKLNIDG